MSGREDPAFKAWLDEARAKPLEAALGPTRWKSVTGSEKIGPCPHCGGDDRFSINNAKRVWNCRGGNLDGSNIGGHDPISLVMHIDGLEFLDAVRKLNGDPPAPPKKDQWEPITPLPEQALPPVVWMDRRKPDFTWVFRDAESRPIGVECRWIINGEKETRFAVWCRHKESGKEAWRLKHLTKPRPIYGLDRLAQRPDAPVLIVEGAKKCEPAELLFPDYVAIAWPAGVGNASYVDWAPLKGRHVTIWPDNDDPGRAAAPEIAGLALESGALTARIVQVPAAEYPHKWDLANEPPTGADLVGLLAGAKPYVPEAKDDPGQKINGRAVPDYMWQGKGNNRSLVGNSYNASVMLHEAALAGIVAFDEMLDATLLMHPVPQPGDDAEPEVGEFQPRPLTDADEVGIQLWMQKAGLPLISLQAVRNVIARRARDRAFHPVRDYLRSLKWDSESRIETWLSRYLGAKDDAYTRQIGMMFLISMVARVMKPGAKVDYMLVLEGKQGLKKSTACTILGDRWFSSSLPEIASGKEAMHHLQGMWLIEIAEMHATSSVAASGLKSFLSREVDRYRVPYGHNSIFAPRQCVFIGTTNDEAYLKDQTGNRRFWPVKVGVVDTEALRKDRDQLFAEALQHYELGEKWWPDAEFENNVIAREQEDRREEDAWEPLISEWLKTKIKVRVIDAATDALGIDRGKVTRHDQNRIMAILTRCEWERGPRGGPDGARYWQRCVSASVPVSPQLFENKDYLTH